jgi:caffeoyl-CoA O-methyltransferase
MLSLFGPALDAYAVRHTSPLPPVYAWLREETYARTDLPQMAVGHLEGRFLKLLVQLLGAKRAVEVGTFTGYSALSIAEGLPDDGHLLTLDVSQTWTAIARKAWAMVPWGARIELVLGPAAETLGRLEGPLDFAFIDADKPGYTTYWDLIVPKLRPGGLVVSDNVLWSGRVLEAEPSDADTRALVAFNQHVARDARVEHVMLTVRDGLMLARKK